MHLARANRSRDGLAKLQAARFRRRDWRQRRADRRRHGNQSRPVNRHAPDLDDADALAVRPFERLEWPAPERLKQGWVTIQRDVGNRIFT